MYHFLTIESFQEVKLAFYIVYDLQTSMKIMGRSDVSQGLRTISPL